MNVNKVVLGISIAAILIAIVIPSIIIVNKNHQEKLYNSIVLKINEAAKKCNIQEKCNNDKIFLKELYDGKYLEKQVNPLTKKYFNEDSYSIKKKGKYVFIEAE